MQQSKTNKQKITQKYLSQKWKDSDTCECNCHKSDLVYVELVSLLNCEMCFYVMLAGLLHMANRTSTNTITVLTNLFESLSQSGLDSFLLLVVLLKLWAI